MEEKSVFPDPIKKFHLSPLKYMNDIISDLEQSDVSNDPMSCNNFVEGKIYAESGNEKYISEISCQLEENESKNDGEDLDLLFEKDLSDIDFEISKDMFADIKLKEEDVIGNVSSHITNSSEKNINFKLPDYDENLVKKITSLDSEIKDKSEEMIHENSNPNHPIEMILQGSLEIPFSPNIEDIVESEKNKMYSSPNEEVQRIMSELQETSLIKKINQDSNGILDRKDNNYNSNVSVNFRSGENDIRDKEKLKDSILSSEENVFSSTLESNESGDNRDMILDEIDLKSREKYSVLANQISENISYNDSIQAVIESVIQNSIQQDLDLSDSSEEKEINRKQNEKKTPYGIFEVVVPLIGKNVMKLGNDVPFTHRYDLARKQNEMRGKFQKNDLDFPIPNMSFEEWRKKRESRTKEEIAIEERKKVINAVQLAKSFTKIAIRILLEYEKDEPNQAAMTKFFRYFELAPASPLSLLYAPHFVHTMMLCRGDEDLSPNLRRAANECYDKCHALFPIPEGYNFETVYTSEVKKYVPDELDKLSDLVLDYGDYDSSDLEDDGSSDSDKDWE